MESLHAERRRFDVVVIDPPAFIKRTKDIPKGEAAYKRLNQLAMQLLERDGVLVSCSCSYHLEPESLVARFSARRVTSAGSCRSSKSAARRPIIRFIRRFRKRAI